LQTPPSEVSRPEFEATDGPGGDEPPARNPGFQTPLSEVQRPENEVAADPPRNPGFQTPLSEVQRPENATRHPPPATAAPRHRRDATATLATCVTW
jgi:hypothetical protein